MNNHLKLTCGGAVASAEVETAAVLLAHLSSDERGEVPEAAARERASKRSIFVLSANMLFFVLSCASMRL